MYPQYWTPSIGGTYQRLSETVAAFFMLKSAGLAARTVVWLRGRGLEALLECAGTDAERRNSAVLGER